MGDQPACRPVEDAIGQAAQYARHGGVACGAGRLTGSKARETLKTVETVIVDEIHALLRDKRGSHWSITLERLEALVEPFRSMDYEIETAVHSFHRLYETIIQSRREHAAA